MIRNKDWNLNPFLNRPMSIANVDQKKGLFELQILVSGKGTKLLSELNENTSIQVIGPLGNSFKLPSVKDNVALIAGGIGIAPLLYFEKLLKQKNIKTNFFYGASTHTELIPEEYLPENIRISTDDGSTGFNGFVTQDFANFTKNNKIQRIYSCGPNPMLKAVQEIALKENIECELSIETVMACGLGICQGCIVPKKENENEYYLTCTEGPVFNAKSIILD